MDNQKSSFSVEFYELAGDNILDFPEPWFLCLYNGDVFVVQSLSRVQLFATPWTVACQAPLSSMVTQSLLKFISIESVMLSNHFLLCRSLNSCSGEDGMR